MIGSAISILRTSVLPVWLGWLALLIGVLAMTPIGFFAFIAGGVWILIVALMLARSRCRGPGGHCHLSIR